MSASSKIMSGLSEIYNYYRLRSASSTRAPSSGIQRNRRITYKLNVSSHQCNEIFRSNKFLIHFQQQLDVSISNKCKRKYAAVMLKMWTLGRNTNVCCKKEKASSDLIYVICLLCLVSSPHTEQQWTPRLVCVHLLEGSSPVSPGSSLFLQYFCLLPAGWVITC